MAKKDRNVAIAENFEEMVHVLITLRLHRRDYQAVAKLSEALQQMQDAIKNWSGDRVCVESGQPGGQ